jgi:DNA-binding NarL/FixJ family response regulator
MLGSELVGDSARRSAMSRRRHTSEQIITALREAEVGLANGKTIAIVSRELGISEQT